MPGGLRRELDGDGQVDSVLTGVFRAKERLGRFLLVLSRDGRGRWTRRWLHVETGSPGFSALLDHQGRIWMSCMSCDDRRELVVRQGVFHLTTPED